MTEMIGKAVTVRSGYSGERKAIYVGTLAEIDGRGRMVSLRNARKVMSSQAISAHTVAISGIDEKPRLSPIVEFVLLYEVHEVISASWECLRSVGLLDLAPAVAVVGQANG